MQVGLMSLTLDYQFLEDFTVFETSRFMASQQSKLLDNTPRQKTNLSTIKKLASHLKMHF